MAFTPVQKLSIGTGAALGLLALAGLVAYLSISQMIGGEQVVAATNSNLARLDRVVARTVDAENAQRGFISTGDTAYLEPLATAQSDVEFALDSLRPATEDNPEQRRNLDKLAPLVAKRFSEIRSTVTARQRSGLDSATRILKREKPVRARDGVGSLASQMRVEELRVLGVRTRTMNEKGRAASNFIFAASIFALLLALLALQPLRPSVAQRLAQRLSTQMESVPESQLTLSEEVRHAGDRLARLQQVIAALNGPVTGSDVAQALLTRGAPPMVASLGAVVARDHGTFTVLRTAGETVQQLRTGSAVPAHLAALFAEAARTLEPVVVESRAERLGHYASVGRFSENGTSDGAFVVIPLVASDAVHGALLLAFADNRVFSDDERAYLATLGRIGGQALARAQAAPANA
ncbi:MAG: CHASE3 domain-containing protein [Gemmatimonadales bacterium]